jgi:uncharacterized metal-binding protein
MPNYRTHTGVNFGIGLPVIYYGVFIQNYLNRDLVLIASASFIWATFFLSPDLDLGQSKVTQNWGALKPLWWGYYKLFKHRGLSHSLIFSSFTRIIYLTFMMAFLYFGSHLVIDLYAGTEIKEAAISLQGRFLDSLSQSSSKIVEYKEYLLASVLGIVFSDWIHIVMDRVSTFSKTTSNKRKAA